ncbi:MAG TPA: UDP-N-acetylmuramoyl-tripeptide--D-alanyl-D-alanine ligase [Gemmatimonadales bacterium]|nr:UDP-N-acetylmuramoyl-tripeptide--D-alanyl-D-alanine ligase [Gemmatimonadales bacterium]
MSRFTAAEVRDALGLAATPRAPEFSGVSTDTRSLGPGELFVALAGERFDAHEFLAVARDRGAIAAVVRPGTAPVEGLELLEVPDTLRAYGDLARARRRRLTGPVVCVTGNNGKTTTKEMLAAVLRTRWRTHATRANNNNLVGVPLTILEAPEDVEALVIEGGGNVPGELPRYREIVEPDVTVATNATEGHLEGYGSLEAIVADTVAVAEGVPFAVSGVEPPSLAEGIRRVAARTVTVGWSGADRIPEVVGTDRLARPTVRLGGREVALPLPGRHQALNAAFAWAVAEHLGVDLEAAARALDAVTVPGGRSELTHAGGLTILNDCYNANPHSFGTTIATARELRKGRRLVFVAGTMRELGDDAPRLHREVAEQIAALDPEVIAAVGEFVPAFAPHAARLGDRLLTAPDAPAMGALLASRLQGDEVLVLKGSRGAALERILPAVTGRSVDPH